MKDLQKKTAFGFVYSVLERAGAQGINFVISLLLARILSPDEYGTIALVTVLITICDVFVTYGFGNSLVAQKDADSVSFSTCFYFGLLLSAVLYGVIFLLAPAVAAYYDKEILVPVLRVMGLRIPIAAINSVQQAHVAKTMAFKKLLYATMVGTAISGVVAVIMAFAGFGVWSMVVQYLGTVLISTITLWFLAKWRPILAFSWQKLKRIYQYGWKILVVGLIDTGYTELRSLVIAKRYTSADLAYYSKGNNFPALGMKLVEPAISNVLFASLSHCNDDKEEMKLITRRFTRLSTYLIFPILFGLAAVAKPLIAVLLTEKWLPSVIYLQLGCLGYLFRPLRFVSNSVIKASGRSDLLLKLDIVKKAVGIALLLASVRYGVVAIAVSLVLANAFAMIVNIIPVKKILDYSVWEQFKDILGNLALSLVMALATYALGWMQISMFPLLILQIFCGVVLYVAISAVTKNRSFMTILRAIKSKKKDR